MFILLSLLLIMAAWSMCLPACLSEAPLSRTWPAATDLSLPDENALGPILALVLVTGAGLQQDHGWGVLTVEPTGRAERTVGREDRGR